MPNIWHLAHQTPKKTIMRCVKCQKILRHAIVCSHLWHDTDENAKPNKSFFIQLFLSLQPVFSLFLLQIIRFPHPLTLPHWSLHWSPHPHRYPYLYPPSPSPSPIKPPSPIKLSPSPLVWRLHRRRFEAAIASLIDLLGWGFVEDFEFFFFCWDFWIWNLLEDPMIVIVVCGGGCWFLIGGDCRWAVFVYCWVLSKYII